VKVFSILDGADGSVPHPVKRPGFVMPNLGGDDTISISTLDRDVHINT